jgi:hypothetical protein
MHRKEVVAPLEQRLRQALDAYEEASGRRPAWTDVDPRSSELQPHYRAFASSKYRVPVEPSRGEWIALEIGRKPMLRLVIRASAWPEMRASCASRNLFTTTADVTVRESSLDGDAAPSARGASAPVVALIGHDRERVLEAAKLDGELLSRRTGEPAWRSAGRRLGELLGYPPCCVEHFVRLSGDHANVDAVRAAAERSRRFEPLLNNLSMTFVHAICWYPCTYDCEASLEIASDVDQRMGEERGKAHAFVRRVWAMPRIYFDHRRQLLFEGTGQGEEIRYRSVHAPSAFEAHSPNAEVDWIFYADVVRRVAAGDEVAVAGGIIEVRKRGRSIDQIASSEHPVVLRFG